MENRKTNALGVLENIYIWQHVIKIKTNKKQWFVVGVKDIDTGWQGLSCTNTMHLDPSNRTAINMPPRGIYLRHFSISPLL